MKQLYMKLALNAIHSTAFGFALQFGLPPTSLRNIPTNYTCQTTALLSIYNNHLFQKKPMTLQNQAPNLVLVNLRDNFPARLAKTLGRSAR